jgi:6-phosphogluconolactonase (cycloisomerase 2 family)
MDFKMTRRGALIGAGGAISLGGRRISKVVTYVAAGPDLYLYDVDVAAGTLARKGGAVTVPANIQFACAHASGRFLYVASSDSPSGRGAKGTVHHLSVFRIDPTTGALTAQGAPLALASRPIHVSTDAHSNHLLVAFNEPSALSIHPLATDGSIGKALPVPAGMDAGVFPHEVLTTPDDRQLILVTRGFDAEEGRPEEPGALKVFRYDHGVISQEVSIAPNGGYGFGPRNLGFHPREPWVYVTLERGNALMMFRRQADGLEPEPAFRENTLKDPGHIFGRQMVGTIEVHPSGRFVYVVNRGVNRRKENGKTVFTGGENNIAVFAIDPVSGKPTLVQHIDTHGIHCRTFQIDPSGRLMICAHIVGEEAGQAPHLTVFRIGEDGRLSFVRSYDVETGDRLMWWIGTVKI